MSKTEGGGEGGGTTWTFHDAASSV